MNPDNGNLKGASKKVQNAEGLRFSYFFCDEVLKGVLKGGVPIP